MEIMIAATLSVMILAVALSFMIQNLKSYQYETGKLLINRDIRKFTQQMIDDATYANNFMLFDQTSNLSRLGYTAVGSSDPTDPTYAGYTTDLTVTDPGNPTASSPGTKNVLQGLPGDVVVFIYYANGSDTTIRQLIVYYRSIATTSASDGTNNTTVSARTVSLNRVVVTIPTANQASSIWKLLPDLSAATKPTVIFPYVDGQASDQASSAYRTNKMFYNVISNKVLMIRGRIYENYTAQRLVKSTYNFTVSTRG